VTCNSSSAFSASSAVKSNLENLFTARFARDRGGRRGEYYPSPQMDDPIPIRPSHPPPERSIALACEPKNMSVKKLVTIKILLMTPSTSQLERPVRQSGICIMFNIHQPPKPPKTLPKRAKPCHRPLTNGQDNANL
jgi:hypothetical protein